MMDDLETVFRAIEALHGNDMASRQKACEWLIDFSKSTHAWQLCDRIVHERRSVTSVCFAAQTLRRKILDDFKQLPENFYVSLRDSLIQHLLKVDSTNPKEAVVMTQISLSLIDLYLQVSGWTNFIAELLNKFANTTETPLVMLNILKICTEELNNSSVRIGKNRRDEVELELAAISDDVMKYLSHICQIHSTNKEIVRRSILALSSWMENRQLKLEGLAHNPIISCTLSLFLCPDSVDFDLLDAAENCISSALQAVYNQDQKILQECPTFAKVLYDGVFAMVDPFMKVNAEHNYGKMKFYGRIFQGAVETYLDFVLTTPEQGFGNMKLMELMILMAESCDYMLVDLTFNSWFRISEAMFHGYPDGVDDDGHIIFRPYIKRYVRAALRHCRYQEHIREIPHHDDDFEEFRSKLSENIKDVLFIIGTEQFLQVVAEYLQMVEKVWNEVETAVFFFSSIMFSIHTSEEKFVPNMLDTVINTGDDAHPILLHTMTDFLQNSEEWVRTHPIYLDPVMVWLIRRLRDSKYSQQAAKAMFNYCKTNGKLLKIYFEPLLNIVTYCETTVGQKPETNEYVAQRLLRACACLVNNVPYDELPVRFNALLRPQVDRLHQLVASGDQSYFSAPPGSSAESWAKLAAFPNLWLDRISSVYRFVTPWGQQEAVLQANGHVAEPIVRLVEDTWKVLLLTMRAYMELDIVIESCCRAIRFVIRSLGQLSAPLVKDLVHSMIEIYQNYRHSCFLYLGSILIDEYGAQQTFQQELAYMMAILTKYCSQHLTVPNGFTNYPDSADDLYRMGIRFLQRAPYVFITSSLNLCSLLIELGISGLHVSHADASKSMCTFYTEFFSYIRDQQRYQNNPIDDGGEQAMALYKKYGADLTNTALNACIFNVNSQLLSGLCDVLDGLRIVDQEGFSEFLQKAIEKLPHDTITSASSSYLREFHQNLLSSRTRRQLIDDVKKLRDYYA